MTVLLRLALSGILTGNFGISGVAVIKSLLANKLVRQVSLLLSGTLLVQLINFGFMPLVLRIYGPAEFGELGAFNALLLLLFPLLPLPRIVAADKLLEEAMAAAAIIATAAQAVPVSNRR